MIPELGQLTLILALTAALAQSIVPLFGVVARNPAWMAVGRQAAQAQFYCVAISYACLTWGFISHDFSVAYVAQTSNTQLPLPY